MTDYADYQTPAANASSIYSQRVPLAASSGTGASGSSLSIAGGATFTSPTITLDQIGYECLFLLYMPSTATTPFAEVQFTWVDSASNYTIAMDNYIVACGESGAAVFTQGAGIAKADSLTITIVNLDSSHTINGQYVMIPSSRIYPNDQWHWWNQQVKSATIPGFTLPTIPDDDTVLGLLNAVTIAASSSNYYLFGPWNGLINVGVEVTSGAIANLVVRFRPQPASSYAGGNILGSFTSPAANFQICGCRAPILVVVANTATVSMTLNLSLVRNP